MSSSIDTLFERAMCDHWWIQDNAVVVKRADLEYLKSEDDHRLYNAVVRVSSSIGHYGAIVEEIMSAHRGKGSEWRIGAPSYSRALESAVMSAGYTSDGMADAWTIDVDTHRPAQPDSIIVERVDSLQKIRDMDSVMSASFESARHTKSDVDYLKELEMCTGERARCLRFIAYDKKNREPISTGGLNFYPQLSLAFMWGGCTVSHARGRGVYSALVTTRMRYAQRRGMHKLGLYAMRNTSGPIVKAQGFEKHGPIYFWGRDMTP